MIGARNGLPAQERRIIDLDPGNLPGFSHSEREHPFAPMFGVQRSRVSGEEICRGRGCVQTRTAASNREGRRQSTEI